MARMSHGFAPPPHPGRVAALYLSFIALGTFGAAAVNRVHLSPGWAALCCFSAVIFASLAISWGAEAAQFYVSQGFAVAGVALLQVMPEFMVEAVIAWSGQVDLMFANATGSNRLLIGLGWPFIYAVAAVDSFRHAPEQLRASFVYLQGDGSPAVEVSVDVSDVAAIRRWLQEAIAAIDEGKATTNPGAWCTRCDFASVCPAAPPDAVG